MSDLVEKIIKFPEISTERGEIIRDAKEVKILTRPDVPFRSVTDLKGYHHDRYFKEPSKTNTKDYVPVKKTIAAILARYSHDALLQLGINDNINHPEEYDNDDIAELYDGLDDGTEQDILDINDDMQNIVLQMREQAAHADREHSADGATTPGEANGEAVSDGGAA